MSEETSAFKMRLKPGMAAEYKCGHDEIRPELDVALREANIMDTYPDNEPMATPLQTVFHMM